MPVHTDSHMSFAYFHSSRGEGALFLSLSYSLFLLIYLRVMFFVSLLCLSFTEKERKGASFLEVFCKAVHKAVILMSPTAEETERAKTETGEGKHFNSCHIL